MANSVQFSVDDSSPTIAYSPFPDTFSFPNLTAGWNPYFLDSGFATSIGQTGLGQSQHITSRNGASVTLSWRGTSIQLFGNTTRAGFSLRLDGASLQPNQTNPSNNLLASLDGLVDANHILSLTAITPEVQTPPDSSLLVFDKAVITSPPPANFSDIIFTDHVLEDTDIQLSGRWSFLPASGQPALHESQTEGDRAQAMFSGISVRIFGTTSPQAGNYSVILDGTQFPVLSARSSFTNANSLLFFASGLDPSIPHRIIIRNEGGLLQLKSGGFDIFSSGEPTYVIDAQNYSRYPKNILLIHTSFDCSHSSLPPVQDGSGSNTTTVPSPSPSPSVNERFPRGTIAAFVLAGILAFILITATLFLLLVWRPRRRRREREQQLQRESTYTQRRKSSALRRHDSAASGVHPKEQEVLNIGPQHDNGHITISPDGTNGIGGNTVTNDRRRRDSGKSGFTRWKKDIDRVSGLANLGIRFRHSDDVEGKIEEGEISPRDIERGSGPQDIEEGEPFSSQSSSQSSPGKKKSNNRGSKGKLARMGYPSWAPGFPFRLSSHSRQQTAGASDDNASLSVMTSLSYASNPNIEAYMSVQPPSYAASVSQHTGSNTNSGNSNSPPSVPRSVTRSPQNRSQTDLPLAHDIQEVSQGLALSYAGETAAPGLSSPEEEVSPISFANVAPSQHEQQQQQNRRRQQQQQQQQRQRQQQRAREEASALHSTGMHILGIGGGLTGVGSPISVRSAIRGLSPRISKSRSGEHARERARERKREREREREQEREREHEHEQQEREREQQRERERRMQRQREEERERLRQREQEESRRHKRASHRTSRRTSQQQQQQQRRIREEPSDPHSDIATVGHHQQQASTSSAVVMSTVAPPLPPLPQPHLPSTPLPRPPLPTPLVPVPSTSLRPSSSGSVSGSASGSPIRALPPIPITPARPSLAPIPLPPIPSQSDPPSQGRDQSQTTAQSRPQSQDQQGSGDLTTSPTRPLPNTAGPTEFLSVRDSSPFRLEFDHGAIAGAAPAVEGGGPSSARGSSTRWRGRSAPGDDAGMGSLTAAAVQSLVAATSGTAVESENDGTGVGVGEVEAPVASRRQSTASRVHFEDDPTSTSNTSAEGQLPPENTGKGKEKEQQQQKESRSRFRLTPPSGQSPTSPIGVVTDTTPVAIGMTLSSDTGHSRSHEGDRGALSFLDLSSQPPSLHSRHASEGSARDTGQTSGPSSGRVWSMQLPGRNVPPPAVLKSKWSTTTIQSGVSGSGSSNSNSGLGSVIHEQQSQGSPQSYIFPFPLSIPPSPHLPEGFPGVEPPPSVYSPQAEMGGLSVPKKSREAESGMHLQVPSGSHASSSGHSHGHRTRTRVRGPAHEHDDQERDQDQEVTSRSAARLSTDTAESPTDSFPYSISEVHFRTSLSDSERPHGGDEEDTGVIQYVHQHLYAHPPLPVTPLTPQRFTPPSTSSSQAQQQSQSQQQSNTPTSIVQRVFGGGSGNGSRPRTPLAGFLKPPSST